MKNEVKKKMTIDSSKLRHQSHDERISSTNVNHFLQAALMRFRDATSRIKQSHAILALTAHESLESRNHDGDN